MLTRMPARCSLFMFGKKSTAFTSTSLRVGLTEPIGFKLPGEPYTSITWLIVSSMLHLLPKHFVHTSRLAGSLQDVRPSPSHLEQVILPLLSFRIASTCSVVKLHPRFMLAIVIPFNHVVVDTVSQCLPSAVQFSTH